MTHRSSDDVGEEEDGERSKQFSDIGHSTKDLRVRRVEEDSSGEGGSDSRFEELMEESSVRAASTKRQQMNLYDGRSERNGRTKRE